MYNIEKGSYGPGKHNTTDIILYICLFRRRWGTNKNIMQNALKNNDVFYPENYELRAGYISLILYFAKQTKEKKKTS